MPRKDGTGPNGNGSMTGKGMGNCSGGQGGRGQGNGMMGRMGMNGNSSVNPKDSKEALRKQANLLEIQLAEINRRLNDSE